VPQPDETISRAEFASTLDRLGERLTSWPEGTGLPADVEAVLLTLWASAQDDDPRIAGLTQREGAFIARAHDEYLELVDEQFPPSASAREQSLLVLRRALVELSRPQPLAVEDDVADPGD
jgi:hypothetical protein